AAPTHGRRARAGRPGPGAHPADVPVRENHRPRALQPQVGLRQPAAEVHPRPRPPRSGARPWRRGRRSPARPRVHAARRARLDLRAPATLVLGQSYSKGWRAFCDGRSLGEPRVVDGYANGWDAKPPCASVRFAFGPDRPVRIVQLFSGIACLLLLLLVIWP